MERSSSPPSPGLRELGALRLARLGPETLPTPEEIDLPSLWLARVMAGFRAAPASIGDSHER